MNVAFPFHFDHRGRTADANDHIRELIEQLLFTSMGERVNRPDLGTGIMQLVFGPNSPELGAAAQHLIQGALQQWLGELIVVAAVDVHSDDANLVITVRYAERKSQQRRVAEFSRPLP